MLREGLGRFWFVILILLVPGCARTVTHYPLLAEELGEDYFSQPGPGRWWGDAAPPDLEDILLARAEGMRRRYAVPPGAPKPIHSSLILSGGGANGAFGAGILAGWTQSGKRPVFEYVTGVSTGAMIAPFAFLGADYDDAMITAYSSITSDDVYKKVGGTSIFFGSAYADTSPLVDLVSSYVTPELVAAIAEQARQGRVLQVVTTHFDALRPMIWDIGYIAQNAGEEAVDRIIQIIVASAAIPAAFPPVAIEQEIAGRKFTELHVDGGVMHDVFAYPPGIRPGEIDDILGIEFDRRVYIIVNGKERLPYSPAPVKTLPILARTIQALVYNQSNADVDRVYYLSQRDNIDFNMIAMPETFDAGQSTNFDPAYMKSAIELGKRIARPGDFWLDRPSSERLLDD